MPKNTVEHAALKRNYQVKKTAFNTLAAISYGCLPLILFNEPECISP
jgi:hypothetical protein